MKTYPRFGEDRGCASSSPSSSPSSVTVPLPRRAPRYPRSPLRPRSRSRATRPREGSAGGPTCAGRPAGVGAAEAPAPARVAAGADGGDVPAARGRESRDPWVEALADTPSLPECLIVELVCRLSRRDCEELRESTLAEIALAPARKHAILVSVLYRCRLITYEDALLMVDKTEDLVHADARLDLDRATVTVEDGVVHFDEPAKIRIGEGLGFVMSSWPREPHPHRMDAEKSQREVFNVGTFDTGDIRRAMAMMRPVQDEVVMLGDYTFDE